jgi:hypothetical protein
MVSNVLNKVVENILKEDKLVLGKVTLCVYCAVVITQVIEKAKGLNCVFHLHKLYKSL